MTAMRTTPPTMARRPTNCAILILSAGIQTSWWFGYIALTFYVSATAVATEPHFRINHDMGTDPYPYPYPSQHSDNLSTTFTQQDIDNAIADFTDFTVYLSGLWSSLFQSDAEFPSPPPEIVLFPVPEGYTPENPERFESPLETTADRNNFRAEVLERHDPTLRVGQTVISHLAQNPYDTPTAFASPPRGVDPTRPNPPPKLASGSATAADPISLADGAFTMRHIDISLPGAQSLTFERSYRSRSEGRSILGSNWTFNWDVWLRKVTVDNAPAWAPHQLVGAEAGVLLSGILLNDGCEGSTIFVNTENGYIAPHGSGEILTWESGWLLTGPDGRTRRFNDLGYLTEDRDRFGNGFRIEYEPTHLYTIEQRFLGGPQPIPEDNKAAIQIRYALGDHLARQWYHEDNYAFGATQVFYDFIDHWDYSSYLSDGSDWLGGSDRDFVIQRRAKGPFEAHIALDPDRRMPWLEAAEDDLQTQVEIVGVYNSFIDDLEFYKRLKIRFGFKQETLDGRPLAMFMGLVNDGLFTDREGTLRGGFSEAERGRIRNFNLSLLVEYLYPGRFRKLFEEPTHPSFPNLPGNNHPPFRASVAGEKLPHRYDEITWFKHSYQVAKRFLFDEGGQPVAWTRHALDGGHRLRPTKVTDDLGRALVFEYYDPTDETAQDAGLLRSISGPSGIVVKFAYTSPSYQPHQNNERFLHRVTRKDGPPTAPVVAAGPQSYAFDYQWTQPELSQHLVKNAWAMWRLYNGAKTTAAVPMSTRYLSEVSDNIIRVWHNELVESETAYEVYPFGPPYASTFDRVIVQRSGGEELPESEVGGTGLATHGVRLMTWQTRLPETKIDYGPERPADLYGWLPGELLQHYPLESRPPNIPTTSLVSPYFSLTPTQGADVALQRSWLNARQLSAAASILGYDIVYSSSATDYFLFDTGGDAFARILATRERTKRDINRICQWVNAGGKFYGLNFWGQELVVAVDNGHEVICFEKTFNEDGLPTAVRRPMGQQRTYLGSPRPWTPGEGGTRLIYPSLESNAATAWRSHLNLVAAIELPKDGPIRCYNEDLDYEDVQARHTKYFYEPCFNQLIEIRTVIEPKTGPRRVGYVVQYEYECDGVPPTAGHLEALVPLPQGANKADGALKHNAQNTAADRYNEHIRFLQLCERSLGRVASSQDLRDFAQARRPRIQEIVKEHDNDKVRSALEQVVGILDGAINRDHLESLTLTTKVRAMQIQLQVALGGMKVALDGDLTVVEPTDAPPPLSAMNPCCKGRPSRMTSEKPEHPDTKRVIELRWNAHGRLVESVETGGHARRFEYFVGNGTGANQASNSEGSGPLARITSSRYDLEYPASFGPPHAPHPLLKGPLQWLVPATNVSSPSDVLAALGLPPTAVERILDVANPTSDAQESHMSFGYNQLGDTTLVDVDGSRSEIQRDSMGRPVRLRKSDGPTWTFDYDTAGNCTSATATGEDGTLVAKTFLEYDRNGNTTRSRRLRSADDIGIVDRMSFTRYGDLKTHIAADGIKTLYIYDSMRRLMEVRRSQQVRNVSVLRAQLRKYARLLPFLDTLQLFIPVDLLDMLRVVFGDDSPFVRRLEAIAVNDGPVQQTTWYSWRHDGALRAYGHSQPLWQHEPFMEQYSYDGFGRATGYIDARGNSYTMRYTDRDEVVAVTQEFTDISSYEAARDAGRPPWVERRRYTYDDHGRALTEDRDDVRVIHLQRSPTGTIASARRTDFGTQFVTYDRDGNVVWSRAADGSDHVRVWNPQSRSELRIDILRRAGGGVPHATCGELFYDRQNRLLRRVDYGGATDRQTLLTHRRNGDEIIVRSSDGTVSVYEHNMLHWLEHVGGQVLSESATMTHFHRDPAGQITHVVDPSGAQTRYSYDLLGRVVEENRPGLAAPHRWEYDGNGRVRRQSLPDGTTYGTGYTWPSSSQREQLLESGNADALSTRTYDERGRLTGVTDTNVALTRLGVYYFDPTVTCAFQYDDRGRIIFQSSQVGASPEVREVESSWETLPGDQGSGRNVKYPSGTVWKFEYDSAGRLNTMVRGSRAAITFAYAGSRYLGRSQSWRDGQLRERVAYNQFGEPVAWTYSVLHRDGTGDPIDFERSDESRLGSAWPLAQILITRDVRGRVGSLTNLRFDNPTYGTAGSPAAVGPGEGRGSWHGYIYAANSTLAYDLKLEDVPSGFTPPDSIDGPDGLRTFVAAAGLSPETIEYRRERTVGAPRDIVNHTTTESYWHAGPREAGHRLSKLDIRGQGLEIVHDVNGRIVKGFERTYVYDDRDRLIAQLGTAGNVIQAYAYDGLDRLAATYDQDGLTHFVYDGAQIVAAYNEAGAVIWEAAWGVGLDHLVEWESAAGGTYIPLSDHRNSIMGLWSVRARRVVETCQYDPDGRIARYDSVGRLITRDKGTEFADPSRTGIPFGFTTALTLKASNLVYMRNRWYSPLLTQFLTPDPLGYTDSFNPYSYAAFDPINNWDPFGLESQGFVNDKAIYTQDEPAVYQKPLFFYQAGDNSPFRPIGYVNTGYGAVADYAMSFASTWANFISIPVNAAFELAALPEKGMRGLGVSQEDIDAFNFASMVTPLGGMANVGRMGALGAGRSAGAVAPEITTVKTTSARLQALERVADSRGVKALVTDAKAVTAFKAAMDARRSRAIGRYGWNLQRNRFDRRFPLWGPIHHWRYPISRYANEAMSMENLYFTTGRTIHDELHFAIGKHGAPFQSMEWGAEREMQMMFNFWLSP